MKYLKFWLSGIEKPEKSSTNWKKLTRGLFAEQIDFLLTKNRQLIQRFAINENIYE